MSAIQHDPLPWLDAFYARVYRRVPRRYVELWLLVSAAGILVLPWPAQQLTQLPLWGPGAHDARTFWASMVCGLAIVLIAVPWLMFGRFRPIIAFLRGEPVQHARVWAAAVREMPVAVIVWVVAFCTFGDIPTVLLAGSDRGWQPDDYVAAWLSAALVTATAGFYFVLIWEVALRPVLRDLDLGADFVPTRRWLTLGRRSAVANATVMVYVGITVSAVVGAASGREAAMAVALVATGTAALTFGGSITALVSHSVFTRICDLRQALERIGAGDFEVRISLCAGDELDDAGRALNAMAARLGVAESQLRGSRARLTSVADEERRRMERDLRERVESGLQDMAAELAGLAALLDPHDAVGADLDRLRASLTASTEEIRRLAHGLYPAALESEGLDAALDEVVRRLPIPATYEPSGVQLDHERAAAVYFCCSEALTNAAKHAGPAATVTVRTVVRDGRLEFTVTDDGDGFGESAAGQGLSNMHDRIRAFGGNVEIWSRPGVGTTVSGWVWLN